MAPSGSGKKTVVDGLGDVADKLYFAKTYTTRKPREGTEENPLYSFISKQEFEELIKKDEFIEWAEFSGNYYGTPKTEVLGPLQEEKVVFKEMELQGVEQMRKLVPKKHMTVIYLDAGSWESLRRRILARSAMTEEELLLRHERYTVESAAMPAADVIVKNLDNNIEEAQRNFKNVINEILVKNK